MYEHECVRERKSARERESTVQYVHPPFGHRPCFVDPQTTLTSRSARKNGGGAVMSLIRLLIQSRASKSIWFRRMQ